MKPDFTFLSTDEDPSLALEWLDRTGSAVDLSAATFTVKLVDGGWSTVLTSAGTFTGYSSLQGSSPNQYNLLISFGSGELAVRPGDYRLIVQATIASRQRTFRPADPPVVRIVAAPS